MLWLHAAAETVCTCKFIHGKERTQIFTNLSFFSRTFLPTATRRVNGRIEKITRDEAPQRFIFALTSLVDDDAI